MISGSHHRVQLVPDRLLELNVHNNLERVTKAENISPWWLEEGTEVCSACGQAYVYQTEYRCTACDDAVCSTCAVETFAVSFICGPCCEPEE